MSNDSNAVSAPASNAIAKQEVSTEVELPLFDTTVFLNTPGLEKAFGLVPIHRINKDSGKKEVVGGLLRLDKRTEMAKSFGLEGKVNKDKLDDAIRAEQVKAFHRVRAWLLTRPEGGTGLARMSQRLVGKDGITQTTVVIRDIPARDRYHLEKYAAAKGFTVEELADAIAKLEAEKANKTVNVQATVTSAPVGKK